MQVIVKEGALENLIAKLVKEERSFHTRNVSELEKAAPPILPQPEMAQQLSTSTMPIEDNEFVPTNKSELGKAAMQLTNQVEDENIKKFYENFKQLIKKFKEKEAQLKEAKLKSGFVDEPFEDTPRRKRGKAAEPDVGVIGTRPEEDVADVQAAISSNAPTRVPSADTSKPARRALRGGASPGSDDPAAMYLASIGTRKLSTQTQGVTLPLSDMAVGDASKLIDAIIKKIGQDDITPEILEAEVQKSIDNLDYSIKDTKIVITSPDYGVTFTYDTEGDRNNLFSLDQYKEVLRALASQKSAGTQFQQSWGPKYDAAIRRMQYAQADSQLRQSIGDSVVAMQEAITGAVLASYPSDQALLKTSEVADKIEIANSDAVDAFTSAGLKIGLNSVSIDVMGVPVDLTLNIPDTPAAQKIIADNKFPGMLESMLSVTPEAIRNYVAKKKRTPRSAVPMDRGMQNFFYDVGMKLGGRGFKMSAEEFQTRFTAAQEIVEEAGLELSDSDIAEMILLKGDILDSNQLEILASVKEVIYGLFSNYIQSNPDLIKKFGIDALLDAFPEEHTQLRPDFAEIFDDFSTNIIKAFTDKKVSNALFKIYDNVVDDPLTKAYFKETAGVKHSQIYDQPPLPKRRAKDVSNLAGNLRHISEFMKNKVKDMRKGGSTLMAGKLDSAANDLVDPEAISSTLRLFFKTSKRQEVHPAAKKAVDDAVKSLLKLGSIAAPVTSAMGQEKPAALSPEPESQSLTPEELPASNPAEISKTYDNIIDSFVKASDDEKEMMLQDFEGAADPEGTGPSARQKAKYPALTTASDYDTLVDKLTQLSEAASQSSLISLIHEIAHR